MKPNLELVEFIKEARRRGFDDTAIKEPLLSNGWPLEDIERAFASLKEEYKFKNKICVFLDSDVVKLLDKRARRNLFTLSEQIEDILRRSVLTSRSSVKAEKLDDMLLTFFSRRKRR